MRIALAAVPGGAEGSAQIIIRSGLMPQFRRENFLAL